MGKTLTEDQIRKRRKINKITFSVFGVLAVGIIFLAIFGARVTTWNHPVYRDYPGAKIDAIRALLLKESDEITTVEMTNDTLLEVHNRISKKSSAFKDNDYDVLIWLSAQNGGVRATVSSKWDDAKKAEDLSNIWLDNISHIVKPS